MTTKPEQSALLVPDGYALVSVDALKVWGKYDEVRNACQFPAEQAEQEPVGGILPCPFCGDSHPTVFEGSTFRWRVAVCDNCGAYAPEVRHDTLAEDQKQAGIGSDAAAITAWNTRAAPVRTKDLTDDEIDGLANQLVAPFPTAHHLSVFARAVIAADREKNR